MYPELSEAERFPLLSQRGRKLLHQMRQHPNAPVWNWPNGEQLNQVGLDRVRSFDQQLRTANWSCGRGEPDWLEQYKEYCLSTVPYYRSRSRPGTSFAELPTCSRADLAPRAWQFVPDDQPVDELIVFSSSGTTGHPTRTPHHPYSAACGVPLLEKALRDLHGIEFPRGTNQVALTNIAAYPGAFTTAIVVSPLEEAGCIRVNLDESAWRNVNDRSLYINAWKAPIWLGDPIAFGAMERLELDHQPQAIISSIMHLNESYAKQLCERFRCPVLDVIAMTEAGIIAVNDGQYGYRILPHDLFVEILDSIGNRCAEGQPGEITLTGGRNPFLPLLRYRTSDFASLRIVNGQRYLVDFCGRASVDYLSETGRTVHSMEVVRLMRAYPVRRYELKAVDEGYQLWLEGCFDPLPIVAGLRQMLGNRIVEVFVDQNRLETSSGA
ncbi:MAG: hypothetical protein U0930_05995 [Pirellulales bacterium]